MQNNQNVSKGFEDKEFCLRDQDFQDIANRIYNLAGIVLGEQKKDMVYGRISRRIRDLDLSSFEEYRNYLKGSKGDDEIQNFVNALTTNLTSFFREPHHFEHFSKEIKTLRADDPKGKIRVWCSAASTGQEPYSIAMCLDENNLKGSTDNVKVLCSDVDTNVLGTCQKGIYNQSTLDKLDPKRKKSYFTSIENGNYQIDKKLQDFLAFKQLNLMGNWPMKGPFDVIFCRNVLIYFNNETRAAIVQKMKNLLKVGGVLYLGHSESYPLDYEEVQSEGHTIFRKLK